MTWIVERACAHGDLSRDPCGLARVRAKDGSVVFIGRYGQALVSYHALSRQDSSRNRHHVILVHGFLGEREDFHVIASELRRYDCQLTFFRYPSHVSGWDFMARTLATQISKARPGSVLIGHSLGCRVIADALRHASSQSHKVVFIAPPVGPVRWAQRGHAVPPIRAFLGAALKDLSLGAMPTDGLLGHDLMVIEGRLPGRSGDGWLRPSETDLPFAHQRHVLNRGHRDLLEDERTCQLIAAFAALDQSMMSRGGGSGLLASS